MLKKALTCSILAFQSFLFLYSLFLIEKMCMVLRTFQEYDKALKLIRNKLYWKNKYVICLNLTSLLKNQQNFVFPLILTCYYIILTRRLCGQCVFRFYCSLPRRFQEVMQTPHFDQVLVFIQSPTSNNNNYCLLYTSPSPRDS